MKKDWLVAHKNEIPTEDEETSAFMYVLTSIYMYLFIVVLAIFIAINSMASSWEKDIMGAVTVQIIPIQDDSKHIDKIKTEINLLRTARNYPRIWTKIPA